MIRNEKVNRFYTVKLYEGERFKRTLEQRNREASVDYVNS